MEEGTHEDLLSIPDGLYAGLVHAQQLEAESAPEAPKEDTAAEEELQRKITREAETAPVEENKAQKKRGFFRSVGLLLYEQRRYWPFAVALLIAAVATGSKCHPPQ